MITLEKARYVQTASLLRCKDCKRTFNALTGTSLARLKRRDAWNAYMDALVNGLSIRNAAKAAKIAQNTSFRWRHRMLAAPRVLKDVEMDGIVEVDETYFLESLKGSKNIPPQAWRHSDKAWTFQGTDSRACGPRQAWKAF